MRRAVTLLLILSLAPFVPAGEEVGEDPAVKVIKDLVTSMGGEKALSKIRGFHSTQKGTYKAGAMKSPYSSEMTVMFPDRLVWKLDSAGFSGSMGLDGETAWTNFMCPPARCRGAMAASVREWSLHGQIVLAYPLLTRDDVELTLVKTEKTESGENHHVQIVFGRKQVFQAIIGPSGSGKTTLISLAGEMTHVDGRKGTFVTKLSEPKKFGDIVILTRNETRYFLGGKESSFMAEEVLTHEWNPELPKDHFAMPDRGEFGKISVKEIGEYSALVFVHTGPYDTMGETIGKGMAFVAERELMPMGPAVAIFITDPATVEDPSELKTEIAIPIVVMGPPPTDLPEGVTFRKFEAVKAAAMRVRGEYGTIEAASFTTLAKWVAENGHTSAGMPRIVYFHQPDAIVPEDQTSEPQIPIK